jgi:hypothetical protein
MQESRATHSLPRWDHPGNVGGQNQFHLIYVDELYST